MSGPEPPVLGWPDAQSLLALGADPWRTKDACEGTIIFGATGSGKTSGSGRALARAYLSAGFGGLVLCAKTDEPGLWRGYAEAAGRSGDLVVFGSGGGLSFDFMQHESQRAGAGAGLSENLVALFMEVASVGSGDSRTRGGDPFWDRAMRSLIRNCVDLVSMAGAPVTLRSMFDAVRSAPADRDAARSAEWKAGSACWGLLQEAGDRALGTPWEADFHEVSGFWLAQFPSLGDRTRGSIVAMFSTLAEALMRGRMRELFCSGTTVAPEDVLAGRILLVDLPVKEWSEVGRMAAVILKYCLQKAVERRADNADGRGRPLFIWADECQHFASRYDTLFQATARSSRAASVYLTQNYPSLCASLGGGQDGRTAADALIGNMGTKIFHANSDRETNQLAADLAGKRLQRMRSWGFGSSLGLAGHASAGASANRGRSEAMDLDIQPMEFASLGKGGPEGGYAPEAVVFQNGRLWTATRRPWQKLRFHQRAPEEAPALARNGPRR
ncbi:MAG TPA: hypothetical protein VGG34_15080 [Opitutaceae bacterium]